MIHISLSFIIKEELKLPKLLVTWQVLGRDSIVYPSGMQANTVCIQIAVIYMDILYTLFKIGRCKSFTEDVGRDKQSISCFISVLFRFDRILDIDHGNDFFGFVDLYIVYISLYQIDAGT